MRTVVDSSRFLLEDERERIGRGGTWEKGIIRMLVAAEDGEISDPEVKVIGKEDFTSANQPSTASSNFSSAVTTAAASSTAANTTTDSSNRGFWMGDLYKYSYPRAYAASGLYNLAWAQAVQNKPLNEVLVEFKKENGSMGSVEGRGEEEEKKGCVEGNNGSMASADMVIDDVDDETMHRVTAAADDEMEEGELEEGEIELESEAMVVDDSRTAAGGLGEVGMEDEEELEDRVHCIRKVLENVNACEAEKSFDVACARLRSSVESVQELVLHCWFLSKDALIQQSFGAFKCVNSVFCSMSPEQKEQNKRAMSRLVTDILSLRPALFSPEQMKEIEATMLLFRPDVDNSQRSKINEGQGELPLTDKLILTDSNTLAMNVNEKLNSSKSEVDRICNFDKNDTVTKIELDNTDKGPVMLPDVRVSNSFNLRDKADSGALFDVHTAHEEDSLPSPTRKTPFSFQAKQKLPIGHMVHLYEKDALRAVSSYQQKFGRTSFSTLDELPSPTPSEDGKDEAADNASEEVSSSVSFHEQNNVNTASLLQAVAASPANVTSSTMQNKNTDRTTVVSGPVSNLPSQATAKSRDPRLRFMNSDLNAVSGPAMKRQKNGVECSDLVTENKTATLQSNGRKSLSRARPSDPRKQDIGATVGSATSSLVTAAVSTNNLQAVNTNTTVSLHSLLKDIVVNPSAWMNIFNEQHKSLDLVKGASDPAICSTGSGAAPLSGVASGTVQRTPSTAPLPCSVAQTSSVSDSKVVRMKPRDPRRMLHINTTEPIRTSGSVLPRTSELQEATSHATKGNLDSQKVVNGIETSSMPCVTTSQPDIAKQFTRNLKSIANIISAPQASSTLRNQLQGSSVEGEQQANLDQGARFTLPIKPKNVSNEHSLKPEGGTSVPAQSWSAWKDVEHLFEGYDDQQKAAIQKERARRIEEQRKLFAARKLCLVLDLDHTLLNSAKFSEVDPVHDEILRKKEEQDREKQYRHLFRFPHMGMWTKLRPGIWNFLEKASKLFELHLYTMGNKLYATEMAKVLDPNGTLFAGRVISRGDDGDLIDGDDRISKSKDLEGVLGMESGVIIIDDSVRVWPHNKLNLIVVERYTYFPCSRRQFGLPGPSLLEIDHDERPEDGTLASSLAVIERIHQSFYAHKCLEEVDVRSILASVQRNILAGCRIVFSRVFPVGEANPHLHPLWQTAEQFGAVCTNQLDDQVTHVVANSLGTDKVNWALSNGKVVVHPGWVEASALLYRRVPESDFAIKS